MRSTKRNTRKARVLLWTAQGVLGLVFLFAGGMKFTMPIQVLAAQSHLPGLFMRFIGSAEVLGALGLILPGLLHIKPSLTPLAAAGLVIIMTGATVRTLAGGQIGTAAIPAIVGCLAAYVAYGRCPSTTRRAESQPARPQPVVRRAA